MASVMAQSQTNPGLAVFDDSMEISSDAGRPADDDIDIDIDVPPDDIRPTNDDDMVDDDATETQDDDLMFDEDRLAQNVEEHMEEDLIDYQDEELDDIDGGAEGDAEVLTDSNDFRIPDAAGTLEPTLFEEGDQEQSSVVPNNHAQIDNVLEGSRHHPRIEEASLDPIADEEARSPRSPKDPKEDQKNLELLDTGSTVVPSEPVDSQAELTEQIDHHADHTTSESFQTQSFGGEYTQQSETTGQSYDDMGIHRDKLDSPGEVHTPIAQDHSNETLAEDELPGQYIVTEVHGDTHSSRPFTHLHPVTVLWEEDEVPLFPPDDVSEFFLEDNSLARSQFDGLFAAFRQVLGDACSDQSELCIGFDQLDLVIDELIPQTFHSTLTDIIDVYLHLHRNDGNGKPEPLRLNLTTREKSTVRLASLRQAADEGKGLSQIGLSYSGASRDDIGSDSAEREAEQTSIANQGSHEEEIIDGEHQSLSLTNGPQIQSTTRLSAKNSDDRFAEDRETENEIEAIHETEVQGAYEPIEPTDPGEDAEQVATLATDEHLDAPLEQEYYEEDILDEDDDDGDDDNDLEAIREASNESTGASTIQANDYHEYGAEESNNLQTDQFGEVTDEDAHYEFDGEVHEQDDTWEGQQYGSEDALAESVAHQKSAEVQSVAADDHALGDVGSHQINSVNGDVSTQDTESLKDRQILESAHDAKSSEYQRDSDSNVVTVLPDAARVPEPELPSGNENRGQDGLDAGQLSSDTQDDDDDLSTIEDSHQLFESHDEFEELNNQGPPASEEYDLLDEPDAKHESSSKISVDVSSNFVKKRSWSDQDDGQQELNDGNGAKKARSG